MCVACEQMTYGLYTVKRFALFLKKVNQQVTDHSNEIVKIMKNEKAKNERLYKDSMAKFVDLFASLQVAARPFPPFTCSIRPPPLPLPLPPPLTLCL